VGTERLGLLCVFGECSIRELLSLVLLIIDSLIIERLKYWVLYVAGWSGPLFLCRWSGVAA